jgi:serine/threonine-protein kinase
MQNEPTMVLDGMVGKTIGNYIVRHKLGEGGMGSVYVAEHPSIGKRVALKVLQAEFVSQPEIVSRFFHEAKAVNDIQHPNIVDIIDFGTIAPANPTDPPTVYFIMEYIVGSSLSDLIRREAPLRPERAIAIALQVADALSASHRMGIVHRDLKPDNVMLVSRGREQDFVKLLDFGIAKLTGNATNTHRTRTGMVIGTPQYMSPEQCEGRSNIDHRTDIYALGIVLYQMLTSKVPFAGDGFGEVLIQQMAMPPLAPSAIVPLIPEYLELIVLKALEKRADHRYQRMDDMTLALQAPMQYVESHGGRTGFLTTPIVRDPRMTGAGAAVVMLTPAPNRALQPTTLGGSAAQLTGTAAAKRGTSIAASLALAVAGAGVAVACVVVAVIARSGDHPADRIAAPSAPVSKPEPNPATQPEPAPVQPPPAPAQPAAPPPVTTTAIEAKPAKTVRVSVDSRPEGATVTIDGEETGKTPYAGELDRRDTPVEIKLALAGYVPVTKKVNPSDNVALSLSLVRARRVGARPTPVAPVHGVDPEGTKNPFDRLGKKGQP